MKIQLKNICKNYKNVEAVKELTVDIEEGALVCILGPSGCGKSTTLSMIAGLDMPTSGEILFNGENLTDVAAEDRDIGMVFQNYALYPHMTIMDNIAFPLKMRNVKKKERIEKVRKVAKMMQIEELLNRKPSKLSGGQQQRVAIARAIVKEPKILLLDEPLSNLDARLRIELREEIRTLQRKLNITTVFVTHDQEEALSISDKILLLNNGVLQQYSTPKDMYMDPSNKFVAGFLGNPPMNFIAGIYDSGKVFVESSNINLPLPVEVVKYTDEFNNNPCNQEKCILGIRPEDLVLCDEGEGIVGQIISAQTLGKEVYLNVNIQDITLTACTSWENNYNSGDRVYLKAKRVYLFNR